MNTFAQEMMSQKMKEFEALVEKYKGRPSCSLSDDEAFLVAYANGEQMDFEKKEEGGSFKIIMRTKRAMSAIWDGNKFLLAVKVDTRQAHD